MIVLEFIRYKNIFAVGNHPIEISLSSFDRTLIIGHNGAGKTTLINAICFVLFGKPYSNVNKGNIVNSINKKELLVELEFSIGSKKYLVKRGIKPNVFEIWIDGKLLRLDGKNANYQDHLEDEILRLNFNSFKQIVVVGSGAFTPFMRLGAGERREIVENILDLRVFSAMAALLKERNDNLKEAIKTNELDIERVDLKLGYARRQLEFVRNAIQANQEKSQKRNEEIELQITELETKRQALEEGLTKLKKDFVDVSVLMSKKSTQQREAYKIESEIAVVQKQSNFLEANENCPTCRQTIDSDFKHKCISDNLAVIEAQRIELDKHNETLAKIETILTKMQERQVKIDKLVNARSLLDMKLKGLREEETVEVQDNIADVDQVTKEIVDISNEKSDFEKEKDLLFKRKDLYSLSASLLKDSGIKSKIIATYIPLINKYLNQYLEMMTLYAQFEIDENFKESVKSRYRDDFTYEQFSEGEKDRIDLALLFAWREVAKVKNRINVNLLILDEVFDGSMDSAGLDDLDKILKSLDESTNVFVISHNSQIVENFPRILEFKKVKNFSTMKVRN